MDILFASTQPGAAGSSGGMLSLLPFVLIMLILYFLMIRPQAKRQKEKKLMLEKIKKGDRVVVLAGNFGPTHGPSFIEIRAIENLHEKCEKNFYKSID